MTLRFRLVFVERLYYCASRLPKSNYLHGRIAHHPNRFHGVAGLFSALRGARQTAEKRTFVKSEATLIVLLMIVFMFIGNDTGALICCAALFIRNEIRSHTIPSTQREASSAPCGDQTLILPPPYKA
jgi:hypothetical protein